MLTKNFTGGEALAGYYGELKKLNDSNYNSNLYNNGAKSAINVKEIKPIYNDDAPSYNGYEILNRYFDKAFSKNERLVAFGEDVGLIGDVNQAFAGLQQKHGNTRIFDTGIRESTIIGQGIGLALRGLRPIAEIQYLDYLVYGLEPLTDDVCYTAIQNKWLAALPAYRAYTWAPARRYLA